jgi:uncharacterized membrane protein
MNIMQMQSKSKYNLYLFTFIGAHFLLTFVTGLFRHWGNLTSINDLAHFDQAIWGTLQGSILLNTDVFDMPLSRLALHFDPIQLIFVPLYLVFPTVMWLTAGQSIALSIAAWPVFILASRVFESEKAGLIWAIIYLVNPFVLNAAAWDFHPITLAVPFVAMGMLSVESKNFKLLLFSVLVILLCKEHLGIMAIGFGILWWIKNRQWKPAMALMLIGIVHFYVVLKIIMPVFSPTGQHVMISDGLGQLSRYAWLGQSIGEIIQASISQPLYVLKTVLIHMGGAFYLFLLLLPFLGFSLLGLPFLLPAMADLAANMLPSIALPRSPISYHSATLIPIFTVAAIYGMKRTAKRVSRFSVGELSGLVLVISVILGYYFAAFPLPGAMNFWRPVSFVSWPDPRVEEIRSLVGDDNSISAQANIGAHFSQRKEIYRFPNRLDHVDAVVLWMDTPTKNIHTHTKNENKKRPLYIGMLDCHLQMDRDDFLQSVETLLEDKNFGVLYWSDPWLVFKKDVNNKQDVSHIKSKLEKLRRKW